MTKERFFSPAHFPVGTVVTLKPGFPNFNVDDRFRTVESLVRNDIRSYCILTGRTLDHVGQEVINIDWVDTIVTRGDGQVLIDQGWIGLCLASDRFPVDWSNGITRSGGRMNFDSIFTLQFWLRVQLSKFLPPEALVDLESVSTLLVQQTFVQVSFRRFGPDHFRLNTKRTLRWLKSNANRFLLGYDRLEKQIEKLEEDRWDAEYENERYSDSVEDDPFDPLDYDTLDPLY